MINPHSMNPDWDIFRDPSNEMKIMFIYWYFQMPHFLRILDWKPIDFQNSSIFHNLKSNWAIFRSVIFSALNSINS